MRVQLFLAELPVSLSWDLPLSDVDFERAAIENEFLRLERSKSGDIVVNAPVCALTSTAGSEITYQLREW